MVEDALPVRPPSFDAQRGWIRMEIHRRDHEGLLAIVEQPRWYCWFWALDGGSVYAGVHSGT